MKFIFFSIIGLFLCISCSNKQSNIEGPRFVGRPPQNAFTGLVQLENGEIRHYGHQLFIRSVDKGETWDTVFVKDGNYYGKRSPVSGEYIRLLSGKNDSVFSLRSENGIDGIWRKKLVDTNGAIMLKPAIFIQNGKRAVVGFHTRHRNGCGTYYSDDNGFSWKKSNQINVPDHKPGGFHRGKRWNHGAVEPTVIELNDGKLWMLIRTAQDKHWESFSNDGGETWSEANASRFYGTITMPTIQRLRNGNILFLWSNTTPLPEKENTRGIWEDVFTNRDAIHAAISKDDGVTWHGFREIYLNPLRNDSLMATRFGKQGSLDRSVHQSECIETDKNIVLVSLGQHPNFRALIKFDTNWLFEKERFDDFSNGIENWSVQKYIKGVQGHCAYNRKLGAIVINHPEKKGANVMHLFADKDSTLVCENSGVAFNFPAGKNGEVSFKAKFNSRFEGLQINLHDRWFNPTDTVARHFAIHTFNLKNNMKLNEIDFNENEWYNFSFRWKNENCDLYINNKKISSKPQTFETKNGISYIHFLLPLENNNNGILIESISAKVE